MESRSQLSRARGFGSTNDGVNHWWKQRLTGIALVPLVLWFVMSAVHLAGVELAEFKEWVGSNANPVLLILLIFSLFYHGLLGLQVVIEDYIHREVLKLTLIISAQLFVIIFGSYSIFAVMQLTLGV